MKLLLSSKTKCRKKGEFINQNVPLKNKDSNIACTCKFSVKSRNKFWETNTTKIGRLRLNMRDQKLRNGRIENSGDIGHIYGRQKVSPSPN